MYILIILIMSKQSRNYVNPKIKKPDLKDPAT